MKTPLCNRPTIKLKLAALGMLVAVAAAALGPCYASGQDATSAQKVNAEKRKTMTIQVKAGQKTFTAILEDNGTVEAFKAKLPATVKMTELNGNEKYSRFPEDLPTNSANPGTIRAGDLMIYGKNTLVLFYETFPTSYSYTRLGRITDPAGLATALGAGDVTVTFELQPAPEGSKGRKP